MRRRGSPRVQELVSVPLAHYSDGEERSWLQFLARNLLREGYFCSELVALKSAIDELEPGGGFIAAAAAARTTQATFQRVAGPGGVLERKGLVKPSDEQEHHESMLFPFVSHFLSGAMGESIVDYLCEELPDSDFALAEFPVPHRSVCIAQSLLAARARANLIFFGPPGVGKTEFARALTATSGRRAVGVRRRTNETAASRRSAVNVAIRLSGPDRDLVIVDKADTLLAGAMGIFAFIAGAVEKGWLNDLLEHHNQKVLWIVNHPEAIDPSTRRRFDYSLGFREPDVRDREQQWMRLVHRYQPTDRIPPESVRSLADRYEVGPGAVDRCLALAARTPGDPTRLIPEILDRHLQLVRKPKSHSRAIQTYEPALCKADTNLERVVRSAQAFVAHCELGSREPGDGLSVLLSGPPGTGKTAFAHYLARQIGQPVTEKRLSDILRPFVGQTEAALAAAFAEAAERNSVLLLDEIDSLLTTRSTARASWVVTQVNALLKQMEDHTGVLVCCTNHLAGLDPANLRRFTWKIEFSPPDAIAREGLFGRYFPTVRLDGRNRERLATMEGVCPGDFAVVERRMRFLQEELGAAEVVEAIAKEVEVRGGGQRVVGFGA